MYDKMAVIGDKNSVFAFKAVGVDVYGTSSADKAKDIIKKLNKEGVKVIFLTEDLAENLQSFLVRFRDKTYPAIIPIPSQGKSSGYGINGLKKDMEKAIGTDILFRND